MSSNLQNTSINEIEEQITLLNEKVKCLENIVERQSKQINAQNNILYSLVGGLFSQSTQGKTIASYLELLLDNFTQEDKEYYERTELNQYNKWSIWPTTRQGDEHEERIEQLETKLNTILEIIQEEEQEENNTQEEIETHNAICYSIVSDDDTSLPDLIEISSNITDEIDDYLDEGFGY
jgi:tetrahydromethanopterin S-methyltransferase subunit G